MAKGKVKWFSNAKGYGFILSEEVEGDIFVHHSSIQSEGYRTLDEGEYVAFELVQSEKGLKADGVSRLGAEAQQAEQAEPTEPPPA